MGNWFAIYNFQTCSQYYRDPIYKMRTLSAVLWIKYALDVTFLNESKAVSKRNGEFIMAPLEKFRLYGDSKIVKLAFICTQHRLLKYSRRFLHTEQNGSSLSRYFSAVNDVFRANPDIFCIQCRTGVSNLVKIKHWTQMKRNVLGLFCIQGRN